MWEPYVNKPKNLQWNVFEIGMKFTPGNVDMGCSMVPFSSSRKCEKCKNLIKTNNKIYAYALLKKLIIGFIRTLCLLTALRWPCAGPAARGARIPKFNGVQWGNERNEVREGRLLALIFSTLGGTFSLFRRKWDFLYSVGGRRWIFLFLAQT